MTGGAGFVGSHAVEYYAERGAKITQLSTISVASRRSKLRMKAELQLHTTGNISPRTTPIDLVEGDIRNEELVEDIVPCFAA
ncbi:NAD-dependent epimerase/dehydratase family protein [Halorubrum yunnanense]|uniref:NAD-dependent epimerase/dehydratase family protein n=1 Tax=Halorubrum yunnanense TaxID=1526162 RepID=A0ABD5YFE5_9EURY